MWTKSALDISWIFLSARPDARPSTSPTACPAAYPAPFQARLPEPLPAEYKQSLSLSACLFIPTIRYFEAQSWPPSVKDSPFKSNPQSSRDAYASRSATCLSLPVQRQVIEQWIEIILYSEVISQNISELNRSNSIPTNHCLQYYSANHLKSPTDLLTQVN